MNEHEQAQIVKDALDAAINEHPDLMVLTVIRMAKRDLENGGTARNALYRMQVDFDKIRHIEGFSKWAQRACDCLVASDRIQEANEETNGDRGSSVARAIIEYLERFDLDSARLVYQNDGDKVWQYPNLMRRIESTVVGCRAHGRAHYCHVCRSED